MSERALRPLSVYLPPEVIAKAEKRAEALGVPTATFLRLVIVGKQPAITDEVAVNSKR